MAEVCYTWCLHAPFPDNPIVTSSQFLQPCLAAGEFLHQVASTLTLGALPSSHRSHLWEFGIWQLGAGAHSALLPNVCFECLVGSWLKSCGIILPLIWLSAALNHPRTGFPFSLYRQHQYRTLSSSIYRGGFLQPLLFLEFIEGVLCNPSSFLSL